MSRPRDELLGLGPAPSRTGQPSASADERGGTGPTAPADAPRPSPASPGADQFARFGAWIRQAWRRACGWLADNSFMPAWLPERWRARAWGYALAVLAQLLAFLATMVLDRVFPDFGFPGVLPSLAIVAVALSFGAGPSLLATLAGVALSDYYLVPPSGALSFDRPSAAVGLLLLLAVGVTISVVASRAEVARRRAGALAQEREAMLEAMPDALLVFDERRHMLQMNPAARRLLAIDGNEDYLALTSEQRGARLSGRDLNGAPIPPERWPITRVLRGETLKGATSHDMVIRALDGRDVQVNVSGAPVRDRAGRLVGAAIVLRDISERRRLGEAVRASERQLRATFEQAAMGIALVDLDGRWMRVNPKLGDALGYAPEELLGRPTRDFTHPEDMAYEVELVRRMKAGDLSTFTWEKRYLARDTSAVWANVTATLVRDDDGTPQYFIAIIEDMRQRKALERRTHEALNALLAMAETLVRAPEEDGSPEGSYAAAPVVRRLAELTNSVLGCRRVGINAIDPETGAMWPMAVAGLSPEQERHWWDEQFREARISDWHDQALAARLRAGEVVTLDMTQPPYRDQPDPYQIRDVLIAPMRMGDALVGLLSLDYGGVPHAFTREDIALASAVAQLIALVIERERLSRERAQAEARMLALDEANRRMNEFLGVASHELKTPVTSIKVNLQLAARRLGKLAGEMERGDDPLPREIEPIRGMLERSDRTMGRLTRLVDDLLDMSRIRAGRLELRREPCDLAAIVGEAVQEQRAVAPDRTITLALPDVPAVPVVADEDRIGQVVTNYLTNALKYSPEGAPVEVRLEVAGGRARVSVRDAGPGLPPAEREAIWEPFHRAEGVVVQSGSGVGLGLGLYITKTIVERHGGAVGVESAPGAGATFWFELPLAPID